MQPKEMVHPLVGSVFSAPETRMEREGFLQDASTASMDSSELPEWHTRVTGSKFSAPETGIDQEPAGDSTASVDPSESPDWRARATEIHRARLLPTVSASRSERMNLAHSEATEFQPPVEMRQLASNTVASKAASEYTPLMQMNSVRPDLRASSAEPTARSKQRDISHHTEREPEDIQIHIGRIEVLAVPQAPAATAKASSKTSSLDEYLKRRDRRTV
jgi:hypothetical protein